MSTLGSKTGILLVSHVIWIILIISTRAEAKFGCPVKGPDNVALFRGHVDLVPPLLPPAGQVNFGLFFTGSKWNWVMHQQDLDGDLVADDIFVKAIHKNAPHGESRNTTTGVNLIDVFGPGPLPTEFTVSQHGVHTDFLQTRFDVIGGVTRMTVRFDHTDAIPPPPLDGPGGVNGDCNGNGEPDDADIANETSQDCNSNAVPDECESDCDEDGIPDACEIEAGTALDCNNNNSDDVCDVSGEFSSDLDGNGVPDECQPVPSASAWGMVIMMILVLTAGTLILSCRPRRGKQLT